MEIWRLRGKVLYDDAKRKQWFWKDSSLRFFTTLASHTKERANQTKHVKGSRLQTAPNPSEAGRGGGTNEDGLIHWWHKHIGLTLSCTSIVSGWSFHAPSLISDLRTAASIPHPISLYYLSLYLSLSVLGNRWPLVIWRFSIGAEALGLQAVRGSMMSHAHADDHFRAESAGSAGDGLDTSAWDGLGGGGSWMRDRSAGI